MQRHSSKLVKFENMSLDESVYEIHKGQGLNYLMYLSSCRLGRGSELPKAGLELIRLAWRTTRS